MDADPVDRDGEQVLANGRWFKAASRRLHSEREQQPGDECESRAEILPFSPMPLLFSYGTLQQDDVQISTFGRLLRGERDELPGFEQSLVEIGDAEVVATSGKSHHPIVKWNGQSESRVKGMVFEISDGELASADRYEVSAYCRVAAELASGRRAWVYVDARFAPPGSR